MYPAVTFRYEGIVLGDQFVKPVVKQRTGSKTTTINTYEAIPDADTGEDFFRSKGFVQKLLYLACTTNDLDYKIEANIDDGSGLPVSGTWDELKAEAVLASGADIWVDETNLTTRPYDFYRVMVKPNVADTHGTMSARMNLSSMG